MNCLTIIFLNNTRSAFQNSESTNFWKIHCDKVGHEWEITDFVQHYTLSLTYNVQENPSLNIEQGRLVKKWDIVSTSKHMSMKPQIGLKAS